MFLGSLGTACRPAGDAALRPIPSAPPAAAAASPASSPRQPPSPSSPVRETWDVFFIDQARIGHAVTRYEPCEENGRQLVRIRSQQELTMRRLGQEVRLRVHLISWESPEGQVARFSSETNDGSATIVFRGRCEPDRLILESITQGMTRTTSVPWQPSWGGFFATEQELERKPMTPGEKRSLRALMPLLNQVQVGEVELEAVAYEPVRLLSSEKELLRIRGTLRLGANQIESLMWADRRGEVFKTLLPAMNQTTYRTTKELALAREPGSETMDLGLKSVVKVARPLPHPHQTRRVVYRARLASGDPAAVFASGPTQRVSRLDEHTAEITVDAVRPGKPPRDAAAGPGPGSPELAANNFIQSNDQRVVAMARSVAAEEPDPWRVACALERHVCDVVRTRSLTQALATAADVARSLEGDCTEHAVLLAALCRARNIPARVAVGLVYYPQETGFAYHMWTEVWAHGQWLPIDGTLGLGGIGAAHIKISHSNLDGADSLTAFLPVLEILGRLQLEIVAVDPS